MRLSQVDIKLDHEHTKKKHHIFLTLARRGIEPGSSGPHAIMLTTMPCHFPMFTMCIICKSSVRERVLPWYKGDRKRRENRVYTQ